MNNVSMNDLEYFISNKFPLYIKENWRIIISCEGKRTLILIISLLFINDNPYEYEFL